MSRSAAGALRVEPLDARRHDRNGFQCGKEPLDRYLREQARQDVERKLASVFVVTAEPASSAILGYYSITSSEVALAALPRTLARRIPYPRVPATLLGRLAVAKPVAGRGIGSFMLLNAAARALSPTAPASFAMIVDPVDEDAAAWYAKFGFTPLESDGPRLFLPLATLQRALAGE